MKSFSLTLSKKKTPYALSAKTARFKDGSFSELSLRIPTQEPVDPGDSVLVSFYRRPT